MPAPAIVVVSTDNFVAQIFAIQPVQEGLRVDRRSAFA
jgi:hypothetical protein